MCWWFISTKTDINFIYLKLIMKKKNLIIICVVLVVALIALLPLVFMGGGGGSIEDRLERYKESVKMVIHFRIDGTPLNHGTAFVVNSAGSLVTNAHVVGNEGEDGKLIEPDSQTDVFYIVYEKKHQNKKSVVLQRAYVEKMDPSRDLAWLRVNAPDRKYLKPLSLARTAKEGQMVKALGFPGAFDSDGNMSRVVRSLLVEHVKRNHTMLQDRIELPWNVGIGNLLNVVSVGGAVSQIRDNSSMYTGQGEDARLRIVVHNAQIKGGMSGGPLVNDKGWVVGVNFSTRRDAESINNSIDSSELLHFLSPADGSIDKVAFIERDPDTMIARFRGFWEEASAPAKVVAVLCFILVIGAISVLCVALMKKKPTRGIEPGKRGHGINRNGGRIAPKPQGGNDRPTLPLPPVSSGKTPSLLFVGSDTSGAPLRFRITLDELRQKRSILIGRNHDRCGIHLAYKDISRQQARVIYEEDSEGNVYIFIRDEQGVTNPSMLNGVTLRDKCQLMEGDKLTFGGVTLEFKTEGA